MQPTRTQQRIEELDVLRGFALCGIIFVNIHAMGLAAPFPSAFDQSIDIWTFKITQAIIGGKFYSLFSFMFGLSFGLFIDRIMVKDFPVRPFYWRRMLGLIAMGVLHAVLLFSGDILHMYGIMGLFLALFIRKSNKTLLRWGIVLIVLPIVLYLISWAIPPIREFLEQMGQGSEAALDEPQAEPVPGEEKLRVYTEGNIGDIMLFRLKELGYQLMMIPFFGTQVLGLFLLGMLFHRSNIISRTTTLRPQLKRIVLIALPFGVFAAYAFVNYFSQESDLAVFSLGTLSGFSGFILQGPLLAICYGIAVLLLLQTSMGKSMLRPLRWIGRMSLSNYLMHSVLLGILFYGLGYFNQFSPPELTMIAAIVLILELLWSRWWLQRYRQGPFEWVLRSITYGGLERNKTEDPAEIIEK